MLIEGKKNIGIIGSGAMGGYFATKLSYVGHSVFFLTKKKEEFINAIIQKK